MKYQNKLNTSNLNNKKQTLFRRPFGYKNIVILPVFTCKVITNNQSIHIKQHDDNYNGYPTKQKTGFLAYTPPNKKQVFLAYTPPNKKYVFWDIPHQTKKNCILEKI